MHSPSFMAAVILGTAQVSFAGIGKVARDVEHGIENVVGVALLPRQVTVTITTIPDYCLTTTPVVPGSPATITTTATVPAIASPSNVSLVSSGVVSTLAAPETSSGFQTFGPSIMQSIASQLSATAAVNVSASQLPATAIPATMSPMIVSNATASINSAMTSSISSTTLSNSVPITSARSTSAPAASASAKSGGGQVATGGILTAVLTMFILCGMQSLLY